MRVIQFVVIVPAGKLEEDGDVVKEEIKLSGWWNDGMDL